MWDIGRKKQNEKMKGILPQEEQEGALEGDVPGGVGTGDFEVVEIERHIEKNKWANFNLDKI